jgi:hypothetical protein
VDCVVAVRRLAVGTPYGELAGHLERCLGSLGALTERAPVVMSGGTP